MCFSQAIPFSLLIEKRLVLTCATWGASADHPCPHCLVHKHQLHEVINSSPICTVKTMRNAYKQSLGFPTKTAAEAILKEPWVA